MVNIAKKQKKLLPANSERNQERSPVYHLTFCLSLFANFALGTRIYYTEYYPSVTVVSEETKKKDTEAIASGYGIYSIENYAAHMEALEYATQPGRGYVPNPHRMKTFLPDIKGSYWWNNKTCPESFSIATLDGTYDEAYFTRNGHPNAPRFQNLYYKLVHNITSMVMPGDRHTESMVEFGNGGGYFSKRFINLYGTNFVTVEGTGAGIRETLEHWKVPKSQVVQHDLRNPIFLGRRFDVAACTEVVEHVEPVFASQIILTLVEHADVIWFSFAPEGLINNVWINHPNERPLKMWKNLFDYYGYDVLMMPNEVKVGAMYRGDLIAYKRTRTDLNLPTQQQILEVAKPIIDACKDKPNTEEC